MIYLILQIIFSSAFTLIIKWAQNRKREDVIAIGAVNYIVAALAILPFVLMVDYSSGTSDGVGQTAQTESAQTELSGQPSDSSLSLKEQKPVSSPILGALITGGSMGGIYFVAFFFAIYSIKTVGASSASVVSVLSILMPIVVASLYWGQQPNTLQVAGIGLALVALSLIGAQKKPAEAKSFELKTIGDAKAIKEVSTRGDSELGDTSEPTTQAWIIPVVLIVFFLLCGFSRISQEAFKFVSLPQFRPVFLFAAFTVAGIPSLILLIGRRRWLTPMEWVFGIFLGLSNILQTHFILKAFEYFEGFIVFPVSSAGAVLLTTVIATGMLGERLTRRTCVGIAISVVALFLLHWLPTS